jgi:flagellar biosynthesis anti-sigma factor FlgM
MEISGKNTLVDLSASSRTLSVQQQSPRALRTGEGGPQSDSDRIELSVRSRERQHIDELIRSTPDTRDAKVEEIRSAIANKTYNRNGDAIAAKLIHDHQVDTTA